MTETSSEKKIKLIILWKGKSYEKEHPEHDDVAHIISQFLKAHAHDELSEISHFHLFLLNDPPKVLDSSKTLKTLGIKEGEFLLLTKRPEHVQMTRDIWVAAGMAAYTAAVFSIAIWFLVSVWPPANVTLNVTRTVSIIGTGVSFSLGPESLLVVAMLISGVIGACVFSVFAISLHLGHYKDFDKSWTAWYLLRPFIGAGLALIVSFMVRSGTLTVGSGSSSLNLVGLSGVGALAGVFAEQALRKLNEVADSLFGKSIENTSKGDDIASIA